MITSRKLLGTPIRYEYLLPSTSIRACTPTMVYSVCSYCVRVRSKYCKVWRSLYCTVNQRNLYSDWSGTFDHISWEPGSSQTWEWYLGTPHYSSLDFDVISCNQKWFSFQIILIKCIFGSFFPVLEQMKFFPLNQARPLLSMHASITSCKISEKTNESISIKLHHQGGH